MSEPASPMVEAAELSYRDALDFLFPRTTAIKFGLERTERLLAALGNPHHVVPVVHVGGTNGKEASLPSSSLRWRKPGGGLGPTPRHISSIFVSG